MEVIIILRGKLKTVAVAYRTTRMFLLENTIQIMRNFTIFPVQTGKFEIEEDKISCFPVIKRFH